MQVHFDEPFDPHGIVMVLASSDTGMDELLRTISGLAGGGSVVQLFDPDAITGPTHLQGAYVNAMASFKNGTNISKTRGMEMLLFASMSTQIGDAVKLAGAKTNKLFVVFSDSPRSYSTVKRLLKGIRPLSRSSAHHAEASRRLGLVDDGNLDKMVLQKMAISRIKEL